MNDFELLVRFQLAGDVEPHVESAVRMKIDGRGGVVLYDREDRLVEVLPIAKLEQFSIHKLHQPRAALAA